MNSSHIRGKPGRADGSNHTIQTKASRGLSTTSNNFSSVPEDATAPDNVSAPRSVGELIIGVDIGTTQIAVATAERLYNRQPGRIKLYNGWVGFFMNRSETPATAMYYRDGSALTGNTLQRLINNADPKAYCPDDLIRLWKFMYHHHLGDPRIINIQVRILEQLQRLGKIRNDLLQDFVRILYDQLFIDGKGVSSLRQTYKNFDRLDLKIVVAVPPGRETIAHAEVLQAFVQGPITSTAVSLESEPAALFRAWVQDNEDDQDWIVGKRYLVADGGGGTCCFTRFRLDSLNPLRFSQEYTSESICCGAETISDLFETLISTKIPADCDNRTWHIGRARNTFDEQYKISFGSDENTPPPAFLKPGAKSDTDFIPVTVAEVEACFTPCVTKVIDGIKQQLEIGEPVDYLVLGGGLFQNLYILNNIKRKFSDLQLLEMSKFKGAVAKGSVQSKLDGDTFISTFPIARTKAVTTWMEVTSEVRESDMYRDLVKMKSACNQKWYFRTAMFLVKQGTQSAPEQDYSTEKSAKDARTVYFDLEDKDLVFSERILTFDYRPGQDDWAALSKDKSGNLSWRNMQGEQIPDPEHSEMITWSPFTDDSEVEVNPEEFDTEVNQGVVRGILRYSIEMKAKETWTKYWAKIWSSKKRKKRTGEDLWILSMPVEREPIFTPQAISQSLKDSFDLDTDNHQKFDAQSPAPDITSSNAAQSSGPELPRAPDAPMFTAQRPRAPARPSESRKTPLLPFSSTTIAKVPQVTEVRLVTYGAAANIAPAQQTPNLEPISIARPLQKQSTEGGVGYSVGAERNTGGCWVCLFRHYTCGKQKPKCNECFFLGLECEYGRPHWWYNNKLREEQKVKNKALIKKSRALKKAGLSPGKSSQPRSHKKKTVPVQGFQAVGFTRGTVSSTDAPQQQSNVQTATSLQGRTDSPALLSPRGPDRPIPSIETPKRPRDQSDKGGNTPKSKKPRLEPPASLLPKDPDQPIPSIESLKRPRLNSSKRGNTPQSKTPLLINLLPRSNSSRRVGDAHRRKSDRPTVKVVPAEMQYSGDISDGGVEMGTWFREDSQDDDFIDA